MWSPFPHSVRTEEVTRGCAGFKRVSSTPVKDVTGTMAPMILPGRLLEAVHSQMARLTSQLAMMPLAKACTGQHVLSG